MNDISRYLPLIEQLSLQTLSGATAAPRTRRAAPAAGQRATPADIPGAHTHLIARLGALQPEDPQRERRAFAAYMAFVLHERLGDAVANDPDFDTLVENVVAHFEADEQLRTVMAITAGLLLERVDGA